MVLKTSCFITLEYSSVKRQFFSILNLKVNVLHVFIMFSICLEGEREREGERMCVCDGTVKGGYQETTGYKQG